MRIKKRLNGKALRQVFTLVNGLYLPRDFRTCGVDTDTPAKAFHRPLLNRRPHTRRAFKVVAENQRGY